MHWVATYENGEYLKEFEEGTENSFYDIEQDRLDGFGLVGQEVFRFNNGTGTFYINGDPLEVYYGDKLLTGDTDKDLIQFKEAHSEIKPGSRGKLKNKIDSYNMGYKTKVGDINFKAIVKVFKNKKILEVTLSSENEHDEELRIDFDGEHTFDAPLDGNAGKINFRLG